MHTDGKILNASKSEHLPKPQVHMKSRNGPVQLSFQDQLHEQIRAFATLLADMFHVVPDTGMMDGE